MPQSNARRRYAAYGIILFLLALIAVWVFYEPPYMKELKRMESVETGTKEPVDAVRTALEAVKTKDRRRLAGCLLVYDRTEFDRIAGGLLEQPDLLPAEVIGCGRLVHSHRLDNISVYVRSVPRKTTYQFAMLRDGDGNYKIYGISESANAPCGRKRSAQ